jgi:hypothetical protein
MRLIGLGPIVDIKINGMDDPLPSPSQMVVPLTISLDPGSLAGVHQDWWIAAVRNGSSLFCWTPLNGWTFCTVPVRAHAGPLVALKDRLICKGCIPVGSWRFIFAVDALDNVYKGTFQDSVFVTSY